MELGQHVLCLLGSCGENGFSWKSAINVVRDKAAKLDLTDAIRCNNTGMGVVPYGRGYSHHTDGCWMVLPVGEELKDYENIYQTEFYTGEGYRSKTADGPTDFALFLRKNVHLFTEKNKEWGICVLAHLQQDVSSDTLWQHDLCQIDTDNDQVTYVESGRVVSGKQFRKDMNRTNVYMYRMFVHFISERFGFEVNIREFIDAMNQSFDKFYTAKMAESTKQYLREPWLDEKAWFATDEEMEELAEEILAMGLFSDRDHLDDCSRWLFESGVTCLNPVVNLVMRK